MALISAVGKVSLMAAGFKMRLSWQSLALLNIK
jgi:hypothetical protein